MGIPSKTSNRIRAVSNTSNLCNLIHFSLALVLNTYQVVCMPRKLLPSQTENEQPDIGFSEDEKIAEAQRILSVRLQQRAE